MKTTIKIFIFSFVLISFVNAQTATTDPGVVINGVKWATRNVDKPGTFAAKPQSTGMYYQWNNNIGWASGESLRSTNGSTEWDPDGGDWEDDVKVWATSKNVCPKGWRIPTEAELKRLFAVESKWTETPVSGRVFVDGANKLFLPAAGCREAHNGKLSLLTSNGYYWSSVAVSDTRAYSLTFRFMDDIYINERSSRQTAYSVRCVADTAK